MVSVEEFAGSRSRVPAVLLEVPLSPAALRKHRFPAFQRPQQIGAGLGSEQACIRAPGRDCPDSNLRPFKVTG